MFFAASATREPHKSQPPKENGYKAKQTHCNQYQPGVKQCYWDRRTDGMEGVQVYDPGSEALVLGSAFMCIYELMKSHRGNQL